MAYVTTIGANPEQVEYRLGQQHGCTPAEASDIQFSYHVDGRERPLIWTGAGLVEVGIEPGSELTEDQFDTARALMRGADPRTGEQLVTPKLAVYADAKVALAPLVRAVQARAAAQGVTPVELFASSKKFGQEYARAERSVSREGEAAALRADTAGALADAAGVDVAAVWGQEVYAEAVANLSERVTVTDADGTVREEIRDRRQVIGNMGYDVSFTLPKSHSLLLAFAGEETAARVEKIYSEKVTSTFDWLEKQTAYGMRGKHGEGQQAERIATSGYLGWSMIHRAARPVDGKLVGDPHWHVHVTLANMARGTDGKWSTIAAGGRDLMRHIPAADHILKALIRRELSQELGVQFARSERTGAWEVAAIPDATLVAFSKRGASIAAMLKDLGFDEGEATRKAEDLAAAQTRHGKSHATAAPDTTLRQIWQDEARELGVDPDQLAAAALPGRPPEGPAPAPVGPAPTEGTGAGPAGDAVEEMSAQDRERARLRDVVAQLVDPDTGLTSSMRRFSRVDALAGVADAMDAGAFYVQEIEALTDRALRDAGIIQLPPPPRPGEDSAPGPLLAATRNGARRQLGAGHMSNATRYTTADVVLAEQIILQAAEETGPGQGAAHVQPETVALARSTVEVVQGFPLSEEQAAIVAQLVTSDQALDAVLGPPGTGKTTMMRAARTAWEAEGYTVAGAATAAVAAQNLQTESGIESRTVAQWLKRIQDGDGLAGVDVLVLDEANLTDDRARARLYTAAQDAGTKVVEVGDPKQLRGVGVGSLFGRVHELVAGGQLTVNRRQVEEDERAAIAAWRAGKYADALTSWSDRGRLVATETSEEAMTAMVATWMDQRAGAPDPHAEIRGVVMLAASNESVERLNDVAQAVRAATGETGPEHVYALRAGRALHLREGDHVMIRLNDRAQRMHAGPDVLNGYRGVVDRIDDAGVHVTWQQDTDDGYDTKTAVLSGDFIAGGGLSLGYAMTIHKAEGLTVKADWRSPTGRHQGGTVLAYAPGANEPGMGVATSRHLSRMFLFAAREQVEDADALWENGPPLDEQDLTRRTISGLAEHARATAENANDTPVSDDLSGTRRFAARDQDDEQTEPETATISPSSRTREPRPTPVERPMSSYTFTSDRYGSAERWHVGWEPALQTYYAAVEPLQPGPLAGSADAARYDGMEGGQPREGTVWEGRDDLTGQLQRVRVDENDPTGLAAVDILAVARDGSDTLVGVPDAEEPDESALIAWGDFTTTYTLVDGPAVGPDLTAGGDQEDEQLVDVVGTTYRQATTVRQLQEQLRGRVQLPDDVRAQLLADSATTPRTAPLRDPAAATAGRDSTELAEQWRARRAAAAGPGTSHPGEDENARRREEARRETARREEERRREETRRPDRGRGPRL
jgi:conjugative relaxase-like TrwC/TraI family protein